MANKKLSDMTVASTLSNNDRFYLEQGSGVGSERKISYDALKSAIASGMPFTQTGTGAAARTVDAKLKDVVSLRDFVVGDGGTNDTSAAQNAINQAATAGVPLLWDVQVVTTAPLTVTDKSLFIQGVGGKLIVSHSGKGIVYTSTTRNNRVGIRGLTITTTAGANAIDITFPSTPSLDQVEVILSDLEISGTWTAGPIRLENVTNPVLNSCELEGALGTTLYGVSLEGQCLDAAVTNCRIYLVDTAVKLGGTSEGLAIDGLTAVTVEYGVKAETAGYEPWLAVTNSHINALTACIQTDNRAQSVFSHLLLYANSTAVRANWTGIKLSGTVSANYINIGNVVFNKASSTAACIGVQLVNADYVGIDGCAFMSTDVGIDYDAASTGLRIGTTNRFVGVTTQLQRAGVSQVLALDVDYSTTPVNGTQILGGAAGSNPTVQAVGSDTNIGFNFAAKGGGTLQFLSNGFAALQVFAPASAVNRVRVRGATTGGSPQLLAEGGDTNVNLQLVPKGSGRVQFGSFTSNADAPVTGYIEIIDSAGTIRKLASIA